MICEFLLHGPQAGPPTLEFEAASTMIRHFGLLINAPRRSPGRCDPSAAQTGLLTVVLTGVVGLYFLTAMYSASRRLGSADGSAWEEGLHVVDLAKPADLRRMKAFAAAGRAAMVVMLPTAIAATAIVVKNSSDCGRWT